MKQIRNRIFIQILIPTMLIYITIMLAGLIYVNKSFEKQLVIQKNRDMENISRAVNDWLVTRVSEIVQLSIIPLIREGEKQESIRFLDDWCSRFSFIYDKIFYINLDGKYWNSSGETGNLSKYSFIKKFIGYEKRFYYMDLLPANPQFAGSVVIGVPIIEGEKTKSILLATILIPTIENVLKYFTFDKFDSFMLVNPQSIIIAHSDNSFVEKSENEKYGFEFSSNRILGDNMVFVSVLRTTWKLVAFIDRNSMLKQLYNINILAIASSIIVILAITFVSLAISSFIVQPIRQLTEAVHRMMEGDYGQKICLTTGDELQELADSFNRLGIRMLKIRTDDRFIFLGHLSARMAHEIRKPLHVIHLAAQSMDSKKAYSLKNLEMIKTEVENANSFINEILNFARPDSPNLVRYSLPNLLKKVINKHKLITEEKRIKIRCDIEKDTPMFYFDIIRIEQVLSNLLQNAIEAVSSSPDDSKAKYIAVQLKHIEAREVLVIITDTGPGFNESIIDRIFDPYFTTKENGTGLGLSICYRILMSHGAGITLSNTEDHHGSVKITFPL